MQNASGMGRQSVTKIGETPLYKNRLMDILMTDRKLVNSLSLTDTWNASSVLWISNRNSCPLMNGIPPSRSSVSHFPSVIEFLITALSENRGFICRHTFSNSANALCLLLYVTGASRLMLNRLASSPTQLKFNSIT